MSTLTAILTDTRKAAGFIEPAIAFVGIAQSAVGIGGKSAEVAIQVIDAALRSLAGMADGSLTREQGLARLDELHKSLLGNDAAADAALADRFKT